MAVAAMTIIGCQEKEIETYEPIPNEGSTFELFADIVQTKTTLDGNTYEVDWDEGDVIYMATSGEDTPWSAVPFTYSEGMFTNSSDPKATLDDGNHSVNAIYCAYDQATYHKNTGTTHKLQPIQNQKGETTIHIQDNDALAGSFDVTIPTDEPASVEMSHLYTLMQVNVKNSTGADIEITKFEMTAAGANLAGIFTVSFATPAVEYKSGGSATISVNISEGTVSNGDSFPVYFVMAPLTNYSGDVTFKVTDAVGKTYTKTVPLSGISFEAGKYNTTPYTIKDADVVTPNVTWDLTTNSYTSVSSDKVTWTSDYVNLSLEKGESSSDANAYLGGTNEHTRVYKDHVMTFAPVGKYQIEKIEYFVTETQYVEKLTNSTWTNADVSALGTTVTVTPENGHSKVSATIGAATRFTAITVYYSLDENYVPPTVESIAVSGQKTVFVQNAEFVFGGTVTATYLNGETADVTDKAKFAGYDMSASGIQTVTVSYEENETTVTVDYDIEVLVANADVTDVLNRGVTGVTNTSYGNWADKKVTSNAVYAGNSAGGNESIQLRSNNNNSGVVTTTSGGYAKKVVVEWNTNTANGRTLNVYGKNTAYEAAADLYVSNNQGTLLGTIKYDGEITKVELEILGKYQYVGFRSADGAMYISTIEITWASEASDAPTVPELSVGSDIIEVSSEGGNAGFDYTVIYPVVGVKASASTSVDWISDFNYDTDGRVEFFVSENTLANEREAVVTLAYEGAAKPMTVTIKQKAAESQEPETPETGETSFVKVTSTPTDWTGDYLIVYEAGNLAFNGGLTTLDVASNGKSVTITDGKIVATPEITACKFSIDASGHIKSASGYYIGNTADSNKLNSSTSTQYTNTIVINDDGTAQITGSGNSILRYNATSGQERFRYFKSSTYTSQKAIALYKLQ